MSAAQAGVFGVTVRPRMLNFFKKKSQQPLGKPQQNRVDELANNLQRQGRLGELEHELEKLDQSTLSQAEHESWWHIYGITAFRAGRQQEATARFEEAHRRFPKSALIKFSLGQQYVNAHQLDRGFDLFRACVFPEVPREYVLTQVRYAYLWGRYEVGLIMLRPFLKAYQELKILDDHFLYVRGLPFFGTWWSNFAALSILSGNTQELEKVTTSITRNCHDYDFDNLKTELIAYRDNRPDILLPLIEKRLDGVGSGLPNGYVAMKRAIIKGRLVHDPKEANDLLDGVSLKEIDFPWLADIRTLAKAEIAHRFSQGDMEKRWVDEFMARQAMLFEPDIALNFYLLHYQEKLKPRFRDSRQA